MPVLIDLFGSVLRGISHPSAQNTADALNGLGEAIKTGGLSEEQLREANRHMEEMTKLKIEEQTKLAEEINSSLRAEIASDDWFVRRMRPTFGYLMALTWAAQMFGVAYIMIFRTNEAILVIEAIESLGTIWAIALSVLGIYVYKRSEDKKAQTRIIYRDSLEPEPVINTNATESEKQIQRNLYNN